MSKNNHPNMSFDMHVQTAVQMAIKNNIKAEVAEATIIVAQETKKALSSMKMRLDALENFVVKKGLATDADLKEALWNVQETLFGLTTHEGTAGVGNGLRLRVKEEEIGKETDALPAQESYVVLGDGQLPKNIEDTILGISAGETRSLEVDAPATDTQPAAKYKITLTADRVYKTKNADGQ